MPFFWWWGTGAWDVTWPATNTDLYIPQWDWTNSKKLKNWIPVSTFEPAKWSDDNYVTDAEKIIIWHTSWTNAWDQFTSTTADRLLGRGNWGWAGVAQEITLWTGLSMTWTTLNAIAWSWDMLLWTVQTVTAEKIFDKDKFSTKGTSTGKVILSNNNTSASDYTAILQAKNWTIALTSDITGTNSGTNTWDQTPATILLPKYWTPDYTTLQHYINLDSSWRIEWGLLTDDWAWWVNYSTINWTIKATDSVVWEMTFFKIAWWNIPSASLTDNALNFIYIDNNTTPWTPSVKSTNNRALVKLTNQFVIGRLRKSWTDIETVSWSATLVNFTRAENERLTYRWVERVSGWDIGYVATRCLTSNDWISYLWTTQILTPAQDTSWTDRFSSYHGYSSWRTETTGLSQLDNTHYDDWTSTLATLSTGRYWVHWVYICWKGNLYTVYGRWNYTLAQAQSAVVYAPPTYLSSFAILAAKIIVLKGSNTLTITSAYQTLFPQQSSWNHDALANLAWTSSWHTGTASTIAWFAASTGVSVEYTLSWTWTVLTTTTSPTFVTPILWAFTATTWLIWTDANFTDFPWAKLVVSQANTGHTYTWNIALVWEAIASTSDTWTWLGWVASTNWANQWRWVSWVGKVWNTADGWASMWGYFRSEDTHAWWVNVWVSCKASWSAVGNYALSLAWWDISSLTNNPNWLLQDNQTTALSFDSIWKTWILKFITTDWAEWISMSWTLWVTWTITTGWIIELWHASDTTISRVSAWLVAIEWVNIMTVWSADTVTGLKTLGTTGAIKLGSAVTDKCEIRLNDSALNDETRSWTVLDCVAGATLAVGDVCYLKTADWQWYPNDWILDWTDTWCKLKLGICLLAANDNGATKMLLDWLIASAAFPTFTVGAPVYLDDTAWDLVVAQPSTTNFVIRIVWEAVSATVLHFHPSNDYIVHI